MEKTRVHSSPFWCYKISTNLSWKKRTPCSLQNYTPWLQIVGVSTCSHRNCSENSQCENCLCHTFSKFQYASQGHSSLWHPQSSSSNYGSFLDTRHLWNHSSLSTCLLAPKSFLWYGSPRYGLNQWCSTHPSWSRIEPYVYVRPMTTYKGLDDFPLSRIMDYEIWRASPSS